MRGLTILVMAMIVSLNSFAQRESKVKLKTEQDSLSYAMGVNLIKSLQGQGLEAIDPEVMAEAMQDILDENTPAISEQEAQMFVQAYMQKMQELEMQRNLDEAAAFFEENAQKEGVVTLPSGMQYKILQEGTGPKPGPQSTVKVHYHGTLLDGTVFDSSVDRGQPIDLQANRVIKGWQEALQLMPEGSKWMLYIPQELAYGANPRPGGAIKPYMALIFEVELIEIVSP